MKTTKVTFANGDTITTSINGTNETIKQYYAIGKEFNIGSGENDNLQKVVACQILPEIEFTRVTNDVNGNPRYVCHFLNFITDRDELDLKMGRHPHNIDLSAKYELALSKARKIGGRKFHNKQYGGGIVFQSYNIRDTEKQILELLQPVPAGWDEI